MKKWLCVMCLAWIMWLGGCGHAPARAWFSLVDDRPLQWAAMPDAAESEAVTLEFPWIEALLRFLGL